MLKYQTQCSPFCGFKQPETNNLICSQFTTNTAESAVQKSCSAQLVLTVAFPQFCATNSVRQMMRCCYIPGRKKRCARVSSSLRSAATHHFPCACALFYLFGATRRQTLWQNAFFRSGVLVAFFPARKAHTKVPFKSLALLDSQPSSFAAPLQTRGKTT